MGFSVKALFQATPWAKQNIVREQKFLEAVVSPGTKQIRDSDSQNPHRCHGDKAGQGLFKSLWGPILFQRNNQFISHGSRTHSWEVSEDLGAAAQKCHSSVPAQQAPLVALRVQLLPCAFDAASALILLLYSTQHSKEHFTAVILLSLEGWMSTVSLFCQGWRFLLEYFAVNGYS